MVLTWLHIHWCMSGSHAQTVINKSGYYNKIPYAWPLWHLSSRLSVGTLQPTRPLGRMVFSTFNWQSEDHCQRTHSKCGFFFNLYSTQMQPLYSLKTILKVGDLSSTNAVSAHCFGALSMFRAIGHCVIGRERDVLWPDWLNWWVWPWVPAFDLRIFLTT